MRTIIVMLAATTLAGCQATEEAGNLPGSAEDTQPFAGIAEDAVIRFAGTEPFWGGQVAGDTLIWTTPANMDGTSIAVERFAGRGGLSFTGELSEEDFAIAITPGDCSDGMSERTYPFVVTVTIGNSLLAGCGWRDGDDLGPLP